MRKSILRASAGLQALALMGAGTAASFIVAAPAAAQDYTSGAIIGSVTGNNGAPVAGATITLRSLAQGQVRTLVTSSSGTFSASGLTPGEYAISVAANGYQTYEDTLTVTAAQESRVLVGPLVSVTQSSTVVVTGRRLRQTATGGTTGLNVDVTAVNKNLAIGHNITAVTLLAPTTARGVSGFRSPSGETVPSIGGSSVAENAYYINGLNITNPDTYVGSARVPFYFYKNVDVQTGGYAAEFGRATGGVINATTKSGTNEPFIALHLDWEPRKLSSTHPNIGDPAYPSSIGKLANSDNKQATIEAGGAIIPDHLFVYGLLQANRYKSTSASAASGTYYVNTNNDPFWGGKVDAYINPTQHLEFTIFDTRSNTKTTAYDFTPNSALNGGTVGASKGVENNALGGLNWVARYTGNVTDWLTLSGAYGVSKDRNNLLPSDPNAYYVVDYRASTGCQSGCVISAQPYGSYAIDSTRRRFYRGDADLRLTFAGQHHFRFGFDNEDLSEDKITALTGTNPVRYYYFDNYIRLLTERLGGHVSGTDTAFYAEDSWQTPLDGLTINFGIRDDIFKQYNLIGEQYANYKNNWGPRVAFSYTPPALDKWKFFGSYGRYFIPPAMNLGFRGKDLYFFDYFNYPTGYDSTTFPIDPTTGLPLANVGSSYFATRQACPAIPGGASNPGAPSNEGDTTCVIYGGGIQNPAIAKVVPGSKAEYEDEFILGTRYQATHLLSIGLQATYRTLHQGSEDTDFGPQLAQHFCGTANLYDSLNFTSADFAAAPDPTRCQFYTNNSTYMIWNPGASSITVNDWYSALSGQTMPVNLTGLTFPTMKRTYKALVLDFNRADDGRWMAGGSVTWSKSKGNTEGTVKSDAGNGAQEDAGSTTDMDYVGLEDYAYGLLPNDHRWTFKFYGAYHIGRSFTIGTNILVQSPMHGSCEGIHPTDPIAANYLSNSFYCGDPSTLFTDEDGNQVYGSNIPAPRGTGWKSDWLKQVDLSFRYNIHFGPTDSRMLTLRADVFNVFNTHGVMQRYGENESDFAPGGYYKDTLYLTPLNYQQPRYVRLGLDVMFGGSGPAPAPAPVIAPPPPPPPAAPATQTCPDGTVILATDACPVPPPPPPPPPPPAASGERGQ